MASTSRAGRPRMRSRSVHLHSRIPVAPKAVKPRTKSAQRPQVKGKGKGAGKGTSTNKKSGKAAAVISSDSEDIEVDFPHHPPNQPHEVPTEQSQEPNPPADALAEEQLGTDHPLDIPIEEPHQPANVPAGDAEQPQEPNYPNPLPEQPPIPMANNQLNWSHFKPDFSGKPEEGAEAHLLSTMDCMTTHDFPEDQKVRRFCLTLLGEARLWYATLNVQQQQLNWEGLQDRFRQQYSKFGNTREQYFHAWRSFQFGEATNMIDGYIQKVKQVAALLDYGEPQILELFKNTLPSRLYYMLYQIEDLRVAVETAKRLLTKERQSSASPFMHINQSSSKGKDKMEKKVSLGAVEAVERTTDSIGRLTSLKDKMDTKLDRREDQYRPRVYQGRSRGCGYRQSNYGSRNRSYSRDWYQNNYRGRRKYSNRGGNRNYRSNYRDNSTSRDWNSSRDGNRYNNRSNYRREDSSQRYGNRNQDHGRSRDRDRDRRNRSSSRESSQSRSSSQNRYKNRRQSRDDARNRDRSESSSRSSSHVSTNRDRSRCYSYNEYDHFARECPNDTTVEIQVMLKALF